MLVKRYCSAATGDTSHGRESIKPPETPDGRMSTGAGRQARLRKPWKRSCDCGKDLDGAEGYRWKETHDFLVKLEMSRDDEALHKLKRSPGRRRDPGD